MTTGNAIYTLKAITKARLQTTSGELPSASELRKLLSAAFDEPASQSTEGELAEAALNLLAEDPEFAEPIRIMTTSAAPPQRYLDPASIALTTAAILALQTRIKFKLDHNRKWSLEVDKKAASDSTLKLLIQRLLSLLPK